MPSPGTVSKPESITTPRRFTPTGFFVAPRVWTPDARLPSFLPRAIAACLMSRPIAPCVWFLPSLSLVTGHFRFNTKRPGSPTWAPPSPPHVHPPAPRSHGAVFGILHMPYGFQKSETQNRESGNPESWCGRVGQSKRSFSKRRYPPFRSLHSIQPSNALLDPS